MSLKCKLLTLFKIVIYIIMLQNELTSLKLRESQAHCDQLRHLIGLNEIGHASRVFSGRCADEALEVCRILIALLDTERSIARANAVSASSDKTSG